MNKVLEKKKKRVLEMLQDLKEKVEMGEPTPENEFNYDLLVHVDECVDQALSAWYY